MDLVYSISNVFINKIALENIWISFICSNLALSLARPAVQAQRFGQSGSLNEGRGPKKLRGWRLLKGKLLLLLLEFIFPKAVSSFFSMTTLLLHTLQDYRLCSKSKSTPMKKIRRCVQLSKSHEKLDIILEYKVFKNQKFQKICT